MSVRGGSTARVPLFFFLFFLFKQPRSMCKTVASISKPSRLLLQHANSTQKSPRPRNQTLSFLLQIPFRNDNLASSGFKAKFFICLSCKNHFECICPLILHFSTINEMVRVHLKFPNMLQFGFMKNFFIFQKHFPLERALGALLMDSVRRSV